MSDRFPRFEGLYDASGHALQVGRSTLGRVGPQVSRIWKPERPDTILESSTIFQPLPEGRFDAEAVNLLWRAEAFMALSALGLQFFEDHIIGYTRERFHNKPGHRTVSKMLFGSDWDEIHRYMDTVPGSGIQGGGTGGPGTSPRFDPPNPATGHRPDPDVRSRCASCRPLDRIHVHRRVRRHEHRKGTLSVRPPQQRHDLHQHPAIDLVVPYDVPHEVQALHGNVPPGSLLVAPPRARHRAEPVEGIVLPEGVDQPVGVQRPRDFLEAEPHRPADHDRFGAEDFLPQVEPARRRPVTVGMAVGGRIVRLVECRRFGVRPVDQGARRRSPSAAGPPPCGRTTRR